MNDLFERHRSYWLRKQSVPESINKALVPWRNQGFRFLDLGCGGGRLAGASTGFSEVHAVDQCVPLVAEAATRFPDVRFHVGDFQDRETWNRLGRFHVIASNCAIRKDYCNFCRVTALCLEHLERPGLLVFRIQGREDLATVLPERHRHNLFYGEDEIKAAFDTTIQLFKEEIMGYMHIENLYKNQEILLFKECYAMEKIHGTSAHIAHKEGQLRFFAGGASHDSFVALFDQAFLLQAFRGINVIVYGEAYGGKMQGMSATYGPNLKFAAFDVQIEGMWLSVPQAHEFCIQANLDFVHYVKISTDLNEIDAQRDADSVQAVRNGIGTGHIREGVVLRPLIELTKNNGERIISKHKRDEFKETKTPREVDPEKMKVLEDAQAIADEWVTPMRIQHVLDKIENPCMEKMREIMDAMFEDVEREGAGEIVWSPEVKKAVGKATAVGVRAYFQEQLRK